MKRFFPTALPRVAFRAVSGLAASLLCAAVLPACVGEEGVPRDNTAMLPEGQRVSSVPWNKPLPGENASSGLGQLANDPRIGGVSGVSAGSGNGNF